MLSEVIVLQTHRAAVQDMFLMTATFVICARERCKEAEQSFRDANAMNKKLQKHERDISENPDTKEIKAQASQARDTKRFCFFYYERTWLLLCYYASGRLWQHWVSGVTLPHVDRWFRMFYKAMYESERAF